MLHLFLENCKIGVPTHQSQQRIFNLAAVLGSFKGEPNSFLNTPALKKPKLIFLKKEIASNRTDTLPRFFTSPPNARTRKKCRAPRSAIQCGDGPFRFCCLRTRMDPFLIFFGKGTDPIGLARPDVD